MLDRPGRAPRVVASLRASGAPARPLFLVSPNDRQELRAVQATGADYVLTDWEPGPGDYARKINLGFRSSEEPFVFQGADDLEFQSGWWEACMRALEHLPNGGVVGTNDDCNPQVKRGLHSTHSLVTRDYVERYGLVDAPGYLLYEGYRHGYVDTELVDTARARGMWTHARDAHVTHLHPICGGQMDATYAKALDHGDSRNDLALFRQRRPLWKSRRGRGSRAGV